MSSLLKYRLGIVVLIHLGLVVLANFLAFVLRFDGQIPEHERDLFMAMLPWLLAIRGLAFLPFRLYEGLWRYTSLWELRNIIRAVVWSTLSFYILVRWGFGLGVYPRSVFLIDSLLLIVFLSGIRLTNRVYRELGVLYPHTKRVLVYGAGAAGAAIVCDMRHHARSEYTPIGFIDDDPVKAGRRIHGVKVLGTRELLAEIIVQLKPDTVLVAMPQSEPTVIRSVVKALEPFKLPIQTLPNLRDLLDGKVEVSRIRSLAVEDLLERAPVGLDVEPLHRLISGKRVLVTGAGGSIGSELCRQIAGLNPEALVLCDRYENGLHAVASELVSNSGRGKAHAVIGDVTDPSRMARIMAEYRPQVVFHAAAHKHVPLMESNPCEAVKNNVGGTRILAEMAYAHHVERFILISTDKAVNPTSVMGATKRLGELLVSQMNSRGRTIFASVRFGNVLGSNGSVVPLFLQQIKAGGPVTVTHPDMQRYFMLIPEAVQLVLYAGELAKGGEIFVLDMGSPVKVLDMARNLIRLAGYVPEREIPIAFVGLRPGEKLTEELVGTGEVVEHSSVKKISRVRAHSPSKVKDIRFQAIKLEQLAVAGKTENVMEQLRELLPTYDPQALPREADAQESEQRSPFITEQWRGAAASIDTNQNAA